LSQNRRVGVQGDCFTTEGIDFETDFGKHIAILERSGSLRCGHLHGSGNQQSLSLDRLGKYFRFDLFVHNAFVQRMLIDDYHACFVFRNQIAIMDLESDRLGTSQEGVSDRGIESTVFSGNI